MVVWANQDDPDQQTEYEGQQKQDKNGLYIDRHMFAPLSLWGIDASITQHMYRTFLHVILSGDDTRLRPVMRADFA